MSRNLLKVNEVELTYKTINSNRPCIDDSKSAYKAIKPLFRSFVEHREEFWVILLNQNNICLGVTQISKGGISGTSVDARLIFQAAIKSNSSAIILVHNHPSGSTTPSIQDIEVTKQLIEGGKILDVQVLDHLIITRNAYLSLADEEII